MTFPAAVRLIDGGRATRTERQLPVKPEPMYLTLHEVAERLVISYSQARRLFQDRPGVLVLTSLSRSRGKRDYTTIRVPISVLDAFVAEHTRRGYGRAVKV
jgi:hypothetical protein